MITPTTTLADGALEAANGHRVPNTELSPKWILRCPLLTALVQVLDLEDAIIAVPWEINTSLTEQLLFSVAPPAHMHHQVLSWDPADSSLEKQTWCTAEENGIWFSLRLDHRGEPIGICMLRAKRAKLAQDAAGEKILQSLLRAVEAQLATLKLAQAGRRTQENFSPLACGIAHSVRNPLTGISTVAQLMQSRVGEDPFLLQCMERIGGDVDRVDRVMGELLDYANPVEPCFLREDVYGIIESLLRDMEPYLDASRIVVRLTRSCTLPMVRTDADVLRKVLRILIENSTQGLPDGGKLSIHLSADGANGQSGQDHVLVHVADTGMGIEKGKEKFVFQPFFKADDRRMGLRLATAERLIGLIEGKIRALPGDSLEILISLPQAG